MKVCAGLSLAPSVVTTENHETMKPRSNRDVLVQRLSELLGFEDGAADVLEHLLSIESGNVSRPDG